MVRLSVQEVQSLAEEMPDLSKALVGCDMVVEARISIRVKPDADLASAVVINIIRISPTILDYGKSGLISAEAVIESFISTMLQTRLFFYTLSIRRPL